MRFAELCLARQLTARRELPAGERTPQVVGQSLSQRAAFGFGLNAHNASPACADNELA
jgi:hypothetical protein